MEDQIIEILKNAGCRQTESRKIILSLLFSAKRPLSHQEIALQKVVQSLDRVTIYRTLESLQKAGLLHKVFGSDGIWRFCANKFTEENKCSGNHLHFLCSKCNKMSCLPEQSLPWIETPSGAIIHSKQLLVHGFCAKCAQKKQGSLQ